MLRQKGFSLIEMAVVIAIIGVIAGIGVPSFRQMMLDNRLVTTTNQILAALQQARSEAASRHSPVTLCGGDGDAETPACADDTDWSSGILLLQNRSGTATVIRMLPAASSQGITVTSAANEIVYAADGTTTTTRIITLTDSRSTDNPEICRQIEVNGVGQARSLKGDELVCDE